MNLRLEIALKLLDIRINMKDSRESDMAANKLLEFADKLIQEEKVTRGVYSLVAMIKADEPVMVRKMENDKEYQLVTLNFNTCVAEAASKDTGVIEIPFNKLEIL